MAPRRAQQRSGAQDAVVATSHRGHQSSAGGRWRVRVSAAAALLAALFWPRAAWARTVRRVASREEERIAQLATVGFLALIFIAAYFHSKKEDSSEDSRIKSEVERLVRLKKEFEEAEASEETDDDNMMASLKAAQQKLSSEKEKEEGDGEKKPEGEEGGEAADGKKAEEGEKGEEGKKDEDDKPSGEPPKKE